MGVIPFHFDVPQHQLLLQEFIETAQNTQQVIDNLNDEFFDGKLRYKLYVIPPKEGGFIEFIGISVLLAGGIWRFLHSPLGIKFVKGLTKHEPEYWAEETGKQVREFLKEQKEQNNDLEKIISEKKLAATILAQSTLGFFKQTPKQLEKLGLTQKAFRGALESKNEFYGICLNNQEIKGIGFDESEEFPIKRTDMAELQTKLPNIEDEEEEDIKWKTEIVDVKANSPNWDKEGRMWQGKCENGNVVSFKIEDEGFWKHVETKNIKPDINDSMRIQWAYPKYCKKRTRIRALKILSFNGTPLTEPMNDNELIALLDNFDVEEGLQETLF